MGGEIIGPLLPEAALATGLPPGTVVGATGHDQVMAAVAAGGGGAERIVNACGTAETMMAFVGTNVLDDALAVRGVAVGPHTLPGRIYLMATQRAAGSVLDWSLRTLLAGAAAEDAVRPDAQAYDAAIGVATAVAPGANGVWFVPHLRAGVEDGYLPSLGAGLFGGLHETTTAADLLRAVFEGIVFESARTLASLRAVTGVERDGEVVAVGGPTRNALWMQLKADVYGLPVRVLKHSEGALWGAAMAGARAAGHAATPEEPTPGAQGGADRVFRPSEQSRLYRDLSSAYAGRVARLAALDPDRRLPDGAEPGANDGGALR